MKFIPLYERVLVQEMEGIKTVGDFVLPDNARDDFLMGTVVSVGAGYRKENGELIPLMIKEGMTVLFGPFAGTKIQVNGQQFLSMREGEIVGWIEHESSDRRAAEAAGVQAADGGSAGLA